MAKMNWTKPSADTVAYFERIAPGPPIQARRMFGMPSRFLNGHMLVSVFGDAFMLHLSPSDREECLAAGARPFAPMGRMAKEYVEIVPGHFPDQTLKEWIARGMRYLGSLPPKLEQMREAPRSMGAKSTGPKSMRGKAIAAKSSAGKNGAAAAKAKKKAASKPAVKAKPAAKKKAAKAKRKVAVKAKAKAKQKRAGKKAPARRGRR